MTRRRVLGVIAREPRRGGVVHPARLRVEHFIAGTDKGQKGRMDGLGRPDGDEKLLLGIVAQAVVPGELLGDRGAQGWSAVVRSVVHLARIQRALRRLLDMRRRIEIGSARLEEDDRTALPLQGLPPLKDLPDAGERDRLHPLGQLQ
jgi:hypothetical protein